MSRLVNFKFNELSRIGNDESTYTQEHLMNKQASSYNTYNPFSNKCLGGLDLALNQPNVFINQSTHQIGPLGCNVSDSNLLRKGNLTKQNVKLTLHERPYKCVPYLGRGNVDVYQENKLRLGDTMKEKKSVAQFNEQNYLNLDNYPIHEDIKENVKKCEMEQDVHPSWVRGETDTRLLYQNIAKKK